jgi:hypothetical protein
MNRYYRKEDYELREYTKPGAKNYTAVLTYPFIQGRSWRTKKDDRKVVYKIVSTNAAVKVKAGNFSGCLKISESYPALPGSVKYIYYAPEVGWVLTTTAKVGGREHRNSELLSYSLNAPAKKPQGKKGAEKKEKKAEGKK